MFLFKLAGDCWELGRQSYNNDDHYHTVLWMAEALAKSDLETTFKTVSREEILDYLSFSTFQQGSSMHSIDRSLKVSNILIAYFRKCERSVAIDL